MRKYLPWILTAVFAAYVLSALRLPPQKGGVNLQGFGELPVLSNGRVKPLDSVARSSLLMVSGKQVLRVDGKKKSAIEWLADVMFAPEKANEYKVFEIDSPDVLGLIGIQQTTQRLYSFSTLHPHLEEIETQAGRAAEVRPEERSAFQTAVSNLQERLVLYQRLQNTLQISGAQTVSDEVVRFQATVAPAAEELKTHKHQAGGKISPALEAMGQFFQRYQFMGRAAYFLPLFKEGGKPDSDWATVGQELLDYIQTGKLHPGVTLYAAMADAYRAGDAASFNKALIGWRVWLEGHIQETVDQARYEFRFNHFEPFYQSMILYVIVFLLACFSWMFWPDELNRSALYLLILAFAVHTGGLASRIILQGRPPVTNLYSSAVFVGWAAVLLGIILEYLYRKGLGSAVASAIGFITLIVAHHLATQGDTMEMMRAVLDSNFWLATHVITITIGYSSTFLSGFLAIVYIFRGVFTKTLNEETADTLTRMTYGVVCFSAFFSFVGTVLGGIWADQSWGRFWGWDPKENGALMIVLWNVLILHARWGKYITQRGLMVLAVGGNIITALSWFGVNMLGIGLHSYGFMQKTFYALLTFVLSQAAIIAIGNIPFEKWRSFRKDGKPFPPEQPAIPQ